MENADCMVTNLSSYAIYPLQYCSETGQHTHLNAAFCCELTSVSRGTKLLLLGSPAVSRFSSSTCLMLVVLL